MKAVSIHGPDDVRIDNLPTPTPGPTDVLLKLDACGICGSDLSFARHGYLRECGQPWPLGHEAAGTIVATGSQVDQNLTVGLRTVINPMGTHDNIIGNGGSEGAFADYLLIRNARLGQHLLPIPDGMSCERAALVEPLAVALHGVHQAKLNASDKVVVFGAGPIGLGAVFWLKQLGFEHTVAVDISDQRLELARQLGAAVTINPVSQNLHQELVSAHGPSAPVLGQATVGSDVFIDMAGGPGVLDSIVQQARFKARLVITAVYNKPVSLDLQQMLMKELSLTMALGYPDELPEVLNALASVPEEAIAPYVTDRAPFSAFISAFQTAQQASSGKVMVYFD